MSIAQRYVAAAPIETLLEHPDNPRRGDEDAIDASMAAHGFYGAVLVQESSGFIIAGNHRKRVARRRGEKALPALFLDVDDDQARRIMLMDNWSADQATYDFRELARVLEDLQTAGDLDGAGFDDADLAKLLERWSTPGDPDAIPEPPANPITTLGDLWILGDHRLLCGDSLEAGDVARVLDGITPRLMVTDPPYLVDYAAWDTVGDEAAGVAFFTRYLELALEHLHPQAPIYQWHASRRADLVEQAWKANDLLWHQTCFWRKQRAVLGRSDFMWGIEPCAYGWRAGRRPRAERRPPSSSTNVWELDRAGANPEHPTIKPVALYTDPYTWHLRAGEWAYEPFCGSGTAIVAAELAGDPTDEDNVALEPNTTMAGTAIAAAEVTGRRCAAIEKDPTYVDVACRRWQELTGRLPELDGKPVDFG
jgi:DNA modification methylase